MLLWILPAGFGILSLVFVAANWAAVLSAWRAARSEGAHSYSLIPLAGGIFGALALLAAPDPAFKAWCWLPMVIDPGGLWYFGMLALALHRSRGEAAEREQEILLGEATARRSRALEGSLLGTAAGDALGLACEGLSAARQRKLFPRLDRYGFLFGYGMCSDDTEHAVMLAQALIVSGGDAAHLQRDFAWRLKGWLVGLPAGIGLATLRAIIKLWLFVPPRWSGVRSAGNGPAMRAAILGVAFGADPAQLRVLNQIAAGITHRDARAEEGALAVAVAAHLAATRAAPVSPQEWLDAVSRYVSADGATLTAIRQAVSSVERGETAEALLEHIGSPGGVGGFMLHTVPAVVHVWLRHQDDFAAGIEEMIRLGGDTDTSAAILGGIIGARVGKEGIPAALLERLVEWPRSTTYLSRVARRLAESRALGKPMREVRLFLPALWPRNLFFMIVVLLHGFRRLLPPY